MQVLMDGLDWLNDREWERAIFQRTDVKSANRMMAFNYPRFRKPRVVAVYSSDD